MYISFDIGIHNLAYCIYNIIDNNICIKDWNIIDINKTTCCYTNTKVYKNGNIKELNCSARGNYKSNDDKVYCNKHKEKNCKVIKDNYLIYNYNLYKMLDKISIDLTEIKTILIEQQPAKNQKMKNMSFMLYSYFVKSIIDKNYNIEDYTINFISAKHKLEPQFTKFLNNKYNIPIPEINLKDYKNRKQESINIITGLLDKLTIPENYKNTFLISKKKDDYADCCLQGIWFLFSKKKFK